MTSIGNWRERYELAYWIVSACCVTLAVIMGYRSLNSGKFMPAGLVASLRYMQYYLNCLIAAREVTFLDVCMIYCGKGTECKIAI